MAHPDGEQLAAAHDPDEDRDEEEPDAEPGAEERPQDHGARDPAADARGHLGGGQVAHFGDQKRTQDAPAVHRECRQQVERAQHDVDPGPEPGEGQEWRLCQARPAEAAGQGQDQDAGYGQGEVRGRAGDRDDQLFLGPLGDHGHVRHAAERIDRDLEDVDPVAPRGQTVA